MVQSCAKIANGIQEMVADVVKPKRLLGVRHFQIFMLFLGMVLIFCIRVCMSMAIVAMTDSTKDNTFNWTLQTQSVILSSFNWGYLVLQTPGGELVARFGGMRMLIVVVGVNSLVTLLIPTVAGYGYQFVVMCRVIQGLAQGSLNPSLHYLISKWVPLDEKSRLGAMVYAGCHLGTAIQQIGSGFIAEYLGWPAIFYVNGTLGVLWTAIYCFLGSDCPETSKVISKKEKLYIQKSLDQIGGHPKKLKTPWKSLFTSIPFLALMVAHAGSGYGYWTLLNSMPTYLNQVLGVNIKANGMMTALPYLASYLMSFPLGFMSDYAMKKKWLSVTACRKISNSIGIFGPSIALVTLSYTPADVTIAVSLLTLGVALNAGTFTGYNLVHLDMAPNFAGTMIGITGTFANIVSLNASLVAGALVNDSTLSSEWRKVFFVAAAVYSSSNIVFLIFGSCKRQKWNEPPKENKHENINGEMSNKPDKIV